MQKVSKEHLEMFEGHTLLKPDQVGFFPANHCFLRNVLPNLSDIACQNICVRSKEYLRKCVNELELEMVMTLFTEVFRR